MQLRRGKSLVPLPRPRLFAPSSRRLRRFDFACRHRYQLVYDSQREAAYSRALSRAQAIRMKLGGSPNMAEDFPDKPKGMHWRTYDLLCREAEDAQNRSCPPWLIRQILLK